MKFGCTAGVILFWFCGVCTGVAQTCSHPREPQFYETNGFRVGEVKIESPFDFFFLVRQRLDAIRSTLLLKTGDAFSVSFYNQSFPLVREAVTRDSAFGKDLPTKIVVLEGGLCNCRETDPIRTVDVIYRVFSSDPIPAAQATAEEQAQPVEKAATSVARMNLQPRYAVSPTLGYDRTRRGFGGAEFSAAVPNSLISRFDAAAVVSSSSKRYHAELAGRKESAFVLLSHGEYHVVYDYSAIPAYAIRLASGKVQARFEGYSKPWESARAHTVVRYGLALEQGNQQSSVSTNLPADVLGNSPFGAVRFYGGITSTGRRSEVAISYGLGLTGAGLGDIRYQKHIGDLSYGIRFPGRTHSPWDFAIRLAAGGLTGSGPTLINDRFFGGNSVSYFIAGDRWSVQGGPLIRSIPANRLTGEGFGGTAYFSTNTTVGKVLFASPIIPAEVENSPGFGDAISAAENSAQNWFADDYESSSEESKRLVTTFPPLLKKDLADAETVFASIRASGQPDSQLESALKEGERQARLAQLLVRGVQDSEVRQTDKATKLRQWSQPRSRFVLLVQAMDDIKPRVGAQSAARLQAVQDSITSHLQDLNSAIAAIHTGPVRVAAEGRAARDMARPREAIDSLRFEANRFAVGIVGIFDAARLWPDPNKTRFAVGGGARFSVVNFNMTVGYAFNPTPRQELGQGRGAFFISVTYTNLFH